MRKKKILNRKSVLLSFIALLLSVQSMYAQDALTSLKYIIKNVRLSTDQKVISYDVYLKDVDDNYAIAVPLFTFRLMTPINDLGSNEKTVSVTNGTTELGASNATMTVSGSNWLMKFTQKTTALTYPASLVLSHVGDGTLLGTFNVANADGSIFENLQSFNAIYSGNGITTKSSVSILRPNTIKLAANSTTAQLATNFIGLGASLLTTSTGLNNSNCGHASIFPNPAKDGFNINTGEVPSILNVFDLNGEKLITRQVAGDSYVDISSLASGAYLVEVNGIRTKLVKVNSIY